MKCIQNNEGKSVVAKRFIRTLKNKIFKHMTATSDNVYFNFLNNIVKKYKSAVHRTINMAPKLLFHGLKLLVI